MLLSMAKTSGRCPPSLIGEGRIIEGSQFESKLLLALDGASLQGELSREGCVDFCSWGLLFLL